MKARRILMSVVGMVVCAVGVGIVKLGALGVDPFQSFMSGLDTIVPLDFGTMYVIANLLLLTFSLVVDRRNIGLATFLNLFFFGYITDFTLKLLRTVAVDPGMGLRVGCLLGGTVVICLAVSLYITADMGVSVSDAISIVMSRKWHLASFRVCRICVDVTWVVLGVTTFLLGGHSWQEVPTIAGVGTILSAFCMGPLIAFFNRTVSRPLLEK